MDLFQLHAWSSAGFFALIGISLILFPGLTLGGLIKETRDLTALEAFTARIAGQVYLTLSIVAASYSGLISSFLSSSPSTPPSSQTKPLTAALTFLTATRTILCYVTRTNNAAGVYDAGPRGVSSGGYFNGGPLLLEMVAAAAFTALGGGLLLFGSGAGSDVKGRSHALFDTPEHRSEVKDRHRAKKAS